LFLVLKNKNEGVAVTQTFLNVMNTGDLGHLHALPTWFEIVWNCHTALNKFSEEVQHFTAYILGVC
jgi:hypothetical protein